MKLLKPIFATALFIGWTILLYKDLSRGFSHLNLLSFLDIVGYFWMVCIVVCGMSIAFDYDNK